MSEKIPASAEELRKAKIKRRLGYAILGAMSLYLAIPMMIGAFGGVARGDVWDPYTGEHLSGQESQARWCYDEASRLIQEAGTLDRLKRSWAEPARQWNAKCRRSHPDLHQVILATREDLKSR